MSDELVRQAASSLSAEPVVLAVSGGCDSMVLLDAAARVARASITAVATFDHGTGAAAERAAALVVRRATELGVPYVVGHARSTLRGEAEWRSARWEFLRRVAAANNAGIATAHTRDDQIETVLMRELRGAGARGLAGLAAPSEIRRPFLHRSREELAAYAGRNSVDWIEDPSNDSLDHLRNRVRHQILPALLASSPRLGDTLVDIGERAAALRVVLDAFIEREIPHDASIDALVVARATLSGYDADALRFLWPALAARIGITLDRRGIERLCEFTLHGASAGRIQLSGGFEAVHHRQVISVRPARASDHDGQDELIPLEDGATCGPWRFRRVSGQSEETTTLWSAMLATGGSCTIRRWRAGDRMMVDTDKVARRLKGLLRDAGIAAWDRTARPVVLDGDEIVWVPGVRRGAAATERSGRPLAWFRCERIDST